MNTQRYAILFFIFIASGCGIPIGKKDVNSTLFKSTDELESIVKSIQPGTKKDEVFAKLRLTSNTPNLNVINTEDIHTFVYGRAEARGTPQEVETFRSRLANFRGYTLPITFLTRHGSLGWFNWTIEKAGHEQRLVLIFDNGNLARIVLEGRKAVREKETSYLWEIVWDVIKGSAQGAGEVSARKAAERALP